jgi:hypothetical protein
LLKHVCHPPDKIWVLPLQLWNSPKKAKINDEYYCCNKTLLPYR